METPTESEAGYPEEQPAEITPDDAPGESPQREGAMPSEGGRHGEGGTPGTQSGGDRRATGNPNT